MLSILVYQNPNYSTTFDKETNKKIFKYMYSVIESKII